MTSKPAGNPKALDPRGLDVAALCRLGQVVEGEWPLAEMTRLTDSLAAPAGDEQVRWRAAGRVQPVAGAPQRWLDLRAGADVTLQCQRCLQPLPQRLDVDRRFRFVDDEDEAARLAEESDDDVLALARRFDLHALVEDELILALPLVPRHDACPLPLPAAAPDAAGEGAPEAPHPFAALARLRKTDTPP